MAYDRDMPDYGDLMPVEEFRECVVHGIFIDYDGHGYPARRIVDGDYKMDVDTMILPSNACSAGVIPSDATHVVWFNK